MLVKLALWMTPLLLKKAINSVLTMDFCRRWWTTCHWLPFSFRIELVAPGLISCGDVFQKQWILVTHRNEVSRSFHPFCFLLVLWACAAQIGSRTSGFPNHRGRWCAIPPQSNLSVSRRSCASIGRTFSIISGVLLVDGRPERGSSSVVWTIRKYYLFVPMPTHCTITRFGFRARWIDGIECGLFSNHAALGQTTLRVGRVSV